MLRRHFHYLLFCLVLFAFTPARGDMAINASASLDTFEYDLDNIHLKLEKLNANWQLSPFGEGKLQVNKMQAKRLVITLNESAGKAKDSELPDHIRPPFPISIHQAEVAEVVIVNSSGNHILNNVKFDLEADAKAIKLNSFHADSPWGEATITLQMSTAKPFPLAGVVNLKKPDANTPYDVKTLLSGDLNSLHFESNLLLAKQDGLLAIIQDSEVKSNPIAKIAAVGQLSLQDDYAVTSHISISNFHPENFGNYPATNLNFEINSVGKLLPSPSINVQYTTNNSHWQNQIIESSGKLLLEGTQIRNLDLQANIANNTLNAKGNLGQADNQLEWQADFNDLSKLAEAASGRLSAQGTLSGATENLAANVQLFAEKLRLPNGLNAEKLSGQANIALETHGKMTGEFKAANLQFKQQTPVDATISLAGTSENHQLKLAALDSATGGKELKLNTILQGELLELSSWRGVLKDLTLDGKTNVKLAAPAPLALNDSGISLEKVKLQLAKGTVLIDSALLGLGKFANQFASKGKIDKVALEDLPKGLLALPPTLQGNPVLSGKWNIKADETLNGMLSLWHEAGDLSMTNFNGTSKPLGLQEAKVDALFENNHVQINTNFKGQNLGYLEAQLSTTLSKTDAGFVLLNNAPLTLTGKAQLQTLAWMPMPTSLMDASFDGALDVSVSGNGTLGEPNLSGAINGKNLRFELPTEGVNFTNGLLEATFKNKQLLIKKASWQGGEGTLSATGSYTIEKNKPTIDLDWTANQFTAISRADRLLTIDGAGKTTLVNDILTILGNFTVLKGLVELADEDTPVLGDDVVILGQTDSNPEPALKILLNGLHIDLGKKFTLRGRGVDAALTGALTFTGLTQYLPHTEGNIQVKEGSYFAYGQKLNIERGIINFNGTVDNPAVNIRAMRNSKPVNAGIEITGTVSAPITKLVSDPNVAESEKLSWLVLGHGMEQTSKNDYGLLSLAAGVLLSQGQSIPLQTQLARAAGLDEFSFAGGDANSAAVVFGKRLSSRLYLSYQKSISGLLDVARLTFNMTSRWSLQAEAGTESAVDVLYTFSFK
jgi:translocation and assembly module TamB